MAKKKNGRKYILDTPEKEAPWWRRTLRNSALAIFLSVVTLLSTIVNMYITNKLLPIFQSIHAVDIRVAAVERESDNRKVYIESFIEVRQDVKSMKEDVTEIKRDIKNLLSRP